VQTGRVTRSRLVLPAALLLVLPACGDDGEDREAYVAQANTVCQEALDIHATLAQPTAPGQVAPYVESLVRLARTTSERLSALTPPEDDREEVERRVLDPLAQQVEEGEAFAARVRAAGDDGAQLGALLADIPGLGDIDVQFARDYGMDTCADAAARVTGA
jgi:hypothetical protein